MYATRPASLRRWFSSAATPPFISGTSAMMPTRFRNVSSTVLRIHDHTYMFDCGDGTIRQLGDYDGASHSSIDTVFITHLHGDHIYGLPAFLASMFFKGMNREVNIIGPLGIKAFLEATCSKNWTFMPHCKIHITELLTAKQRPQKDNPWKRGQYQALRPVDGHWEVLSDKRVSVIASPIKHTVACVGYTVKEHDTPGNIVEEEVLKRGLPRGPKWGQLKKGIPQELSDGTMLHPEEVMLPSKRGRKLVLLGDTCDPSSVLDVGQGADLLVHEATMLDDKRSLAVKAGHSTPSMAGDFAKRLGAESLILTHFSNAFGGTFSEASISALRADDPSKAEIRSMEELYKTGFNPRSSQEMIMSRQGKIPGNIVKVSHAFPQVTERSNMRAIVESARKKFQSSRVIAARDFMTVLLHTEHRSDLLREHKGKQESQE